MTMIMTREWERVTVTRSYTLLGREALPTREGATERMLPTRAVITWEEGRVYADVSGPLVRRTGRPSDKINRTRLFFEGYRDEWPDWLLDLVASEAPFTGAGELATGPEHRDVRDGGRLLPPLEEATVVPRWRLRFPPVDEEDEATITSDFWEYPSAVSSYRHFRARGERPVMCASARVQWDDDLLVELPFKEIEVEGE